MATRLETFLLERRIGPTELARASGITRQHLGRLRKGIIEPKRPSINAIVLACRQLTGEAVNAPDLFDLGGVVTEASPPADEARDTAADKGEGPC